MDFQIAWGLDDEGPLHYFVRGHVEVGEFVAALEHYLDEGSLDQARVTHRWWRNVPAPKSQIVCDRQFIESTKGPGAFAVTVYDARETEKKR